MKETTVFVNERVFTGYFTKKGKPRTETVHYAEEMYLNDTPIENNYDALLAINSAEQQIKRIVCSGVNCEYMKPYTQPVEDVFTNLKELLMNYLYTRTAKEEGKENKE